MLRLKHTTFGGKMVKAGSEKCGSLGLDGKLPEVHRADLTDRKTLVRLNG
jgi:hypothetical protein